MVGIEKGGGGGGKKRSMEGKGKENVNEVILYIRVSWMISVQI